VAQILIRKVDERVKARIQRRAKRNGRSMEAEAREILKGLARLYRGGLQSTTRWLQDARPNWLRRGKEGDGPESLATP
jgi:hypothetical protein